jgi:4-nitrophenyl phosphatase
MGRNSSNRTANNATKSRETFKAKFDELGIEANVDEVFGSAFATAAYLKHVLNFDRTAYIIGMSGIEHEFDAVGIKYKGGTVRRDVLSETAAR